MTIEEIKSIPVFFIVGAGRSGTTLLRTVFDAHAEICIPPEGKVIMHLKSKYGSVTLWNEKRINEFVEDLFEDRKFVQMWRVDKEKLKSFITKFPFEELDFGVLIKIVYLQSASLFQKGRTVLIGDKNPFYSLYIEELIEIFPQAKFIHIIRDQRDVIVSNKKHFKRKNVAILSNYWRIYNHYIERSKIRNPSQFLTIKYEDLANEPTNKIKELCVFLGVGFNPGMLNYHTTINEKYRPEDFPIIEKMFPGLLTAIQPVTEKKWIHSLTKDELEMISYITGVMASKYRYESPVTSHHPLKAILSAYGIWVQFTDIAIIKGYYFLPFPVRRLIRRVADKIFKETGIITVYNEEDRFTQKAESVSIREK
jgi:hypothetical protein